ncbi:predicted protein [Plenodomus lingam JN3]|uniref:Predicted protein n=1 Tax=Leptosphaeria maculans (strain JN3 / isolate v23.1.3 / race Av1-4-5-6-7-8) TaxID=985895 RepID=E5AE15_LEPMJ|nr:predicted protein [Plenodomus lingam JN3]CBY01454.1 predicted protein [Plenodomus lingam JN3]
MFPATFVPTSPPPHNPLLQITIRRTHQTLPQIIKAMRQMLGFEKRGEFRGA